MILHVYLTSKSKGIALNSVKSSLHVPVQMLAMIFGALGLFLAKLYTSNFSRPKTDTYHYYLGWTTLGLLFIQIFVGSVQKFFNSFNIASKNEHTCSCPGTSYPSCIESKSKSYPNSTSEEYTFFMGDIKGYSEQSLPSRSLHQVPRYKSKKSASNIILIIKYTDVFCCVFDSIFSKMLLVLVLSQAINGLIVYRSLCP